MLNCAARHLINSLMLRRLPGPFVRDSGHCWIAPLPVHSTSPRRSSLVVYEDGVVLRPSHAAHDEIRDIGFGACAHRDDRVYFSTSDNSDPNANGRTYQFSLSPWLYHRRVGKFGPKGGEPTRPATYRKRDIRPAHLRQDVAYALGVGRSYLDQVRSFIPSLAGKTVLEVGPGMNCGAALLLVAHGARVIVADRFLAPWDAEYHGAFYSAFADELARLDSQADVRPIRAVVEAGGYPEAVLGRCHAPLEQIPLAPGSIDIVLSNAVVEHLYDLPGAFAQLHRITRPGGLGLHQVDHRDHRDFSRPLEYLLAGEKEFQTMFARCHGECGNRYRPYEVAVFFRGAGFEILDFAGNVSAEPMYLEQFVPRLRAATRSRYRDWPAEGLQVVSGLFHVCKL